MEKNLLIARFENLNVGQLPEINDMSAEALEPMVTELETLQSFSLLNLETVTGVENLANTVDRHLQKWQTG